VQANLFRRNEPSHALERFVVSHSAARTGGISGTQRIHDRVSILRFCHLLEEHKLSPKILQVINAKLAAHGLLPKTGTVVDTTLIAAPSSTKDDERDPEMHQVNKGNQWHFGMKAHIGVDAESGLVY
jgi:IS5 family transposase